jgi:hypothetical protein
MSTLTSRVLGSATLRAQSYEDVEADHNANWQALDIVLLSSLGAAFGMGLKSPGDVAIFLIVFVATWISWVLLTLLIGTNLLPGNQTKADFGQVFRTTGFSSAPGVFRVFAFLPVVGWYIFGAVTIWMLFSFVVAIRQALDYPNTGRAFLVCLLGWLIQIVLFFGFITVAY